MRASRSSIVNFRERTCWSRAIDGRPDRRRVIAADRCRRALFEAADAFGQDRDRTGGAISVLIFDLDHFKRTNDHFGHELGDRVLKLFATTNFEGSSIVARLGGEEFAAILPNVDRLGAVETGEAVRHAFAKSGVDGLAVGATVSVGVAGMRAEAVTSTRCSAAPTRRFTPPSAPGATASSCWNRIPRTCCPS
ncbi:MAG: GGDEF domain-containing protein [Methyloceanibacter sp.]